MAILRANQLEIAILIKDYLFQLISSFLFLFFKVLRFLMFSFQESLKKTTLYNYLGKSINSQRTILKMLVK